MNKWVIISNIAFVDVFEGFRKVRVEMATVHIGSNYPESQTLTPSLYPGDEIWRL